MNTYEITYRGESHKFRAFKATTDAKTAANAIEDIYSDFIPDDYFPQQDGSILDSKGNIVRERGEENIRYKGGEFFAIEVSPYTKIK
jgi:hypothetical protein